MKKTMCLILSLLFVVALFSGCGQTDRPGETTAPETTAPALPHVLKVGYGRVNITPKDPVPLAGLFEVRVFEDVRDPLYATCLAYTDETENTVLVFHLDLLNAFSATLLAKRAVSEATGVPVGQIVVSTNHNHSAPNLDKTDYANVMEYCDALKQWMVEAAQAAMADRKPATMSISKTNPEYLAFVRHYIMDDGSYVGDNFGDPAGKTYVSHATEVDDDLQLVKFTREGGKDILLMNHQGHPAGHGEYRNSVLSYIDVVRRNVEKELDCLFAFTLGASGNVNCTTRIKAENVYRSLYETRGAALAEKVVEAAKTTMEPAKTGSIRVLNQTMKAAYKTGSSEGDIAMGVFSLGDLAFVTAPYEMFCENGMDIKKGSPYKMTFISTCTNGSLSYIPSIATFAYGGYEVEMTKFASGTAEMLADGYIAMLKQIHDGGNG